MNAIDLIKDDHREVERLFSEFLAAEDSEVQQREDIFQQLEKELLAHADIEEQIFYPAVKDFMAGEIEEAIYEHQVVERMLSELLAMEVEDEAFEKKLIHLMEQVQHHVQEEESAGGILETARQKLRFDQLEIMAKNMQKLKQTSIDELAA